jgi:hypothetical protein
MPSRVIPLFRYIDTRNCEFKLNSQLHFSCGDHADPCFAGSQAAGLLRVIL